MVPIASKARDITDLDGARFCFTNPDSTTGYFLPRAYMRQQGLDPDALIGSVHWSTDHLQVMRDLINGQCDVAATYSDAFLTANRFGVSTGRLRVLALTGNVPQDVFAAGPGATKEDVRLIKDALLAFSPSQVVNAPRLGENQRVTGFVEISPQLFDELRTLVELEDKANGPAPVALPSPSPTSPDETNNADPQGQGENIPVED